MAARPPWYQMQTTIEQHFSHLRPAQQRGLALWVYGSILAHSACEHAVLSALLTIGTWHGLRQRLRDWLCDGKDKAAPCQIQLDVSLCFAPLLRWLLTWWQGTTLAFAVDATAHGDKVVALVISVLYRGTAIPVAWQILPANQKGAWMGPILRLLRLLRPAVPTKMTVLVQADCGLWSPRLWKRIRDLGWHPVLRVRKETTFAPAGQRRQRAVELVPGPGHAWVGRGVAFKNRKVQRAGTLCVVWGEEHAEPWLVLTDLAPQCVGVVWYGMRVWVELGFRALKGVGWQWQQTRRTEPARVARHWLVLAVATLWVVACGTRVEEAQEAGVVPARLRSPRPQAAARARQVSLFRLGLAWLGGQVARGRVWQRLWLTPERWPEPPVGLVIFCHNAS